RYKRWEIQNKSCFVRRVKNSNNKNRIIINKTMSAWETSDRYHIVGVLLWLDDDCPRRGRNRYGCGEELGRFWCKFEPGSSQILSLVCTEMTTGVVVECWSGMAWRTFCSACEVTFSSSDGFPSE